MYVRSSTESPDFVLIRGKTWQPWAILDSDCLKVYKWNHRSKCLVSNVYNILYQDFSVNLVPMKNMMAIGQFWSLKILLWVKWYLPIVWIEKGIFVCCFLHCHCPINVLMHALKNDMEPVHLLPFSTGNQFEGESNYGIVYDSSVQHCFILYNVLIMCQTSSV